MSLGPPARRSPHPTPAQGRRPRFARSLRLPMRLTLIAALAVPATVLGFIGWSVALTVAGEHPSFSDLLYRVVSLFRFSGGAVPSPTPWQLDAARWLAAAATLYAIYTAATAYLVEAGSSLRAQVFSGHVVVCGLGQVGIRLVEGFRADQRARYRVIVIESDRANSRIDDARALGALVLIGDATRKDVLRSARVAHATHLFAMTDQDAVNADIALAASDLADERENAELTCFVNLNDPVLNAQLKQFAIERATRRTFRFEPFNISERSARALLDRYPAFDPNAPATATPPHVMVVGTNDVAGELIVEIARRWRRHRGESNARIRITVIGEKSAERVAAIKERYQQIGPDHRRSVSDLTPIEMPLDSASFTAARFLFDQGKRVSATAIYVCPGDDALGLSAAIHLRNRLHGSAIPIVVGTSTTRSGVTQLLQTEIEGEVQGRIDVFGMLDCLGDTAVVLDGYIEAVARAIHQAYVERGAKAGETPLTNSSMVPWADLAPDLQKSNRQAAADLGHKLELRGCALEPMTTWDDDDAAEDSEVSITKELLEVLARAEHQRWWDQKKRDGWHKGPKIPGAKQHPDMRPYDELDEATKEKDRVQIRQLADDVRALEFRMVVRPGTDPHA
jgi:hypothetical protein